MRRALPLVSCGFAVVFAVILASGCSDPETFPAMSDSCDGEVVTAGPCEFDGECSDYRVCRDGLCSTPEAMSGTDPAGELVIGGSTFSYELAAGDLARTRGLSGRPCMAEGWGLLLSWPDSAERQIQTSQMRFDLDLLFLDEADVPVSVVYGAAAGSNSLFPSDGAARRVLEVRAGELPDPIGSVERASFEPLSRSGDS